jgi:N-dimethylarginine dimethylaminohydrolase
MQSVLMCPPDHFEVAYVINPWMKEHVAKTDADSAHAQWSALRNEIARHAEVVLLPPRAGLPDLVFTANAGLVLGRRALVSRFRRPERVGEEKHDREMFAGLDFEIVEWPGEIAFEGAGDALFDREQPLLWVGYGFRTDARVPSLLEKLFGRKTAALNLVDPRFYHLDTCLCPLAGGFLLYYPPAFDAASQALIESLTPAEKRIAVDEVDALYFCCNAVELNAHVIMNDASPELQLRLRQAGFTPVVTPLSEFMKAGGGAKCLSLKLIEE